MLDYIGHKINILSLGQKDSFDYLHDFSCNRKER